MDNPRLDKVLWSLRVFTTRSIAMAACRAGHVLIGELEAKPGRDVHLGDVLVVRIGVITRTLKLIAIPRSRVSAKQLPEFMTDDTPQPNMSAGSRPELSTSLAVNGARAAPQERSAGVFRSYSGSAKSVI